MTRTIYDTWKYVKDGSHVHLSTKRESYLSFKRKGVMSTSQTGRDHVHLSTERESRSPLNRKGVCPHLYMKGSCPPINSKGVLSNSQQEENHGHLSTGGKSCPHINRGSCHHINRAWVLASYQHDIVSYPYMLRGRVLTPY